MSNDEKVKEIDGPLIKEIFRNNAITSVISSTISEWDIKSAHLMAIKILKGDKLYENLNRLSKLERNIEIGKMQLNDKTLSSQLQNLLFLFKKEFINKNNIRLMNIIETTKDSFVLSQKIPTNTILDIEGTKVEFVNKDGFYSSFYRIGSKSLLFDSMTGTLRIKGINSEVVSNSPFVDKYLKPLLITLESSVSLGVNNCIDSMANERFRYINNDDENIYRSLNNKNNFLYNINGEIIESTVPINDKNAELIKINNYIDFVMPLMKSII